MTTKKGQKQSTTDSINEFKEGDYLDPDLTLDPNLPEGSELQPGLEPPSDPIPPTKPETQPNPPKDSGYTTVVVTGATLNHDGIEYPNSRTVKLPCKTAERLTAMGLVKPLSVLRQELAALAGPGLSISTEAGGVEITTEG